MACSMELHATDMMYGVLIMSGRIVLVKVNRCGQVCAGVFVPAPLDLCEGISIFYPYVTPPPSKCSAQVKN